MARPRSKSHDSRSFTTVISPGHDAHLSFSTEGPIVWSFALFLGGVVKPPFQYGTQVKVVCVLSCQESQVFVSRHVDLL